MLQKSIEEIYLFEKENAVKCYSYRSVDSQIKKLILENKSIGYVFLTIPYNKEYGVKYTKFPVLVNDAIKFKGKEYYESL